jgi:hypothetical protein
VRIHKCGGAALFGTPHSCGNNQSGRAPDRVKKAEKGIGQRHKGIGKVRANDMKNSPLTTILLGALAVLVLGAVGLCYLFLQNTGQLRALSPQVQLEANQLNARQPIVNALVADAVAYSTNHPSIEPILESAGIKTGKGYPTSGSASTHPKSATK